MIPTSLELKNKIHEACIAQARKKLKGLDTAFTEAAQALSSESKSTAGDKHETGRAMIQLEQEKLEGRYLEARKVLRLLEAVNPTKACTVACSGALVEVEHQLLFIAAPLGRIQIEKAEVFVLGPGAPLAQAMLGKSAGDKIEFNGKVQLLKSIT